jgi:hypothetical protein
MRTSFETKTMRTTCGKTISYVLYGPGNGKIHSLTGPALIYPESEETASEYYIYGIKYKKDRWQELVNQHKAMPIADAFQFDM